MADEYHMSWEYAGFYLVLMVYSLFQTFGVLPNWTHLVFACYSAWACYKLYSEHGL